MSECRKIRFVFESDDPRADGLDPWELNEKCIKGETSGLEHKEVIDENDGESVTIELHFDNRDMLREWFDNNVAEPYYKVAIQI